VNVFQIILKSGGLMDVSLLQMQNISKSFSGVNVLKKVDFELKSGEVHALLGENGAGKSTLIKILGGIHHADSGKIIINGTERKINDVRTARVNGISIIHQEIVLVPYLSVAENLFLGQEKSSAVGTLDKKRMLEEAQGMFDSFGLEIDAASMVAELTIAQRQLVEIVKAVFFNACIIVMDEPTSSLSENEIQKLFVTIRQLKEKGVGIIYISHKLSELFEISDRVTVLRDGHMIATKETAETTANELITMMVGRELTDFYTRTFNEVGEAVLEVKDLCRKGVISKVSFSVRSGEVVGFAGLLGAGRSEIMRAIFGLDPLDSGEIYLKGKKVLISNPRDAINFGIAFVPEDRKKEGLVLENSLMFNMTLLVLSKIMRSLRIDIQKRNQIVENYIKRFSIKTSSEHQIVNSLSGGNQQKVLIAKWLAIEPAVLILDEPTRGVDVGAKAEIYDIINNLAKSGVAVIFISSELPEIINMCDRTYVVCNGKISGHLERSEFTQEKIMTCATEAHHV
jgi:ribose transport system ATP-binding protein/inositol transport system ATP-binding protein